MPLFTSCFRRHNRDPSDVPQASQTQWQQSMEAIAYSQSSCQEDWQGLPRAIQILLQLPREDSRLLRRSLLWRQGFLPLDVSSEICFFVNLRFYLSKVYFILFSPMVVAQLYYQQSLRITSHHSQRCGSKCARLRILYLGPKI